MLSPLFPLDLVYRVTQDYNGQAEGAGSFLSGDLVELLEKYKYFHNYCLTRLHYKEVVNLI